LVLFGAVAAHAQVVTEVKTADRLMVHGVGEVRLLGVEGVGLTPDGDLEKQCAESTRKMVYDLIHAKEVRLVVDDKAKELTDFAMHRYLYLPDGRMLNTVLLESGCARLAAGTDYMQYGAMFKSVANHAQANGRGLYAGNARALVASAPRPATGVTLAAFNRVTLGMSFADVYAILGTGKEISRFESSLFTATSFQWDHPDGIGTIFIGFQDGKVSTKNQFGLK
jgi:endonuclease YncB( thermonuclease family)